MLVGPASGAQPEGFVKQSRFLLLFHLQSPDIDPYPFRLVLLVITTVMSAYYINLSFRKVSHFRKGAVFLGFPYSVSLWKRSRMDSYSK